MRNNLTYQYTKNVEKTRKKQFEQGTHVEVLPALLDHARKTDRPCEFPVCKIVRNVSLKINSKVTQLSN